MDEKKAKKSAARNGEISENLPQAAAVVEYEDETDENELRSQIERDNDERIGRERSPENRAAGRSHILPKVAAIAAIVFIIWLCAQFFTILSAIANLPAWAAFLAYLTLIVCGALIVGAIGTIIYARGKLRSFRQICLDGELDLSGQKQIRKRLKEFLSHYPKERAELEKVGFSENECENLRLTRKRLLEKSSETGNWLLDFDTDFQNTLKLAADRNVKEIALQAGLSTAASPFSLLDSLMVLTLAMRLMGRICAVYNIRADRATMFLLLCRALANSAIANVAQEPLNEIAGGLGARLFGDIPVAGNLAGIVAEGAVNYLFMKRLGASAISLLQPLKLERE